MVTFRTTITTLVLALITALTLILIVIQAWVFQIASKDAAAAYMDAASANALNGLEAQISELGLLVSVMAMSPFLADSDDRSEVGGAIEQFKTAINQLPLMDSLYVGYDNGSWLQVRRLTNLNDDQRRRLGAPSGAVFNINLVRPTAGALPMRRIFTDESGAKLEQLDLWDYGYDPRRRSWYRDTLEADRPIVSAPYLSFSIATPMITLSAPLRGKARGVIATDLKLDSFSEFVNAQRPGEHGTAILFDASGALIAHPDFAGFVEYALTHPARPTLPKIKDLDNPMVSAVMQSWNGDDRHEGTIRGDSGQNFFYRLHKFTLGTQYTGYLLLFAAQDDLVKDIPKLQIRGLLTALFAGGCFVPIIWVFGGRLARALKRITEQARRLRTLAAPDEGLIGSYVREIDELGSTMTVAQRTIWSFGHFVPKEVVKSVIDGSISTELGGDRQELTILFTDVQGFTTIAESAEPDALMHQTSRYFDALTKEFLAEGGTVDKFIGDAVMVFWNAPHPQADHVDRACRAALAARATSERLNAEFAAEGLPPFVTRFGIHVGEAIVGNVGSAERMDYTVLGSTVNLAARLEGLNKDYATSILVSEAIKQRAEGRFRFAAIASVTAKGMTQETRVYELLSVGEASSPTISDLSDPMPAHP